MDASSPRHALEVMHDLSLISTIAAAFTCAWLLGLLTQRLRLSPIVGYLLAGVLLGPHTPGFIADIHIAQQLAEVGIILLMFGVGLHFHLKDLLAVKGVAIPGAIGQSLAATVLAILVFWALGLPVRTGAVLGMAMAVASTVVLMRVLIDADALSSPEGHVAVGWLIVEDIFTVVLLVLIPVLGATAGAADDVNRTPGFWTTLGLALLNLTALVAIMLLAGSRLVPKVLAWVTQLRSRELFTLTILVFAIAIAAGSYTFFGASMALGAFLAGMVVGQSPVSHQAAADALPMRDAFAVLFFVSVGMLFDPSFLIEEPLMIVAGLAIILLAKPAAALLIVALLGHSVRTALTVALGLAQIGEFSFILSQLGQEHGLMPQAGHNVLVASAIISIALNPLLFPMRPQIESWLRGRPRLWSFLNGRAERKAGGANLFAAERVSAGAGSGQRTAVVIGFGPVGRTVNRLLKDAGLTTVVIDLNLDTVSELSAVGETAIFGDASHESILEQAGVRHASHVLLTLPHSSDRVMIINAVRHLNPAARVLVRARYLREREDLEQAGATAAVFEEAEAAVGLARLVLADTGMHREAAERKVRDLRLQLLLENVSSIRGQRVRSVMVPWTRVARLPGDASREQVLTQVAEHRFSRWPVVEPRTDRVLGYLLAKDLISQAASSDDWTRLVRPLPAIQSDADIESTLVWMQSEDVTVSAVEDAGVPVGLITIEDIVEQVVGRIEDEYPHEPRIRLPDAVAAGGIVLNLRGATRDQVISELASAIPAARLPPGVDVGHLAQTREAEVSTDLGVGAAIPHARCASLGTALVAFGRSAEGVVFSPQSPEPVRLVFLVLTPTEQPEVQLALISQIARVAGSEVARERLRRAGSPDEVMRILADAQKPQPPAE